MSSETTLLLDLPPEILCFIVSLCEPEIVTSICRTLTNISYVTPLLWTSIKIGRRQMLNSIIFLPPRLERTNDFPLSISMDNFSVRQPDIAVNNVCAILSPHKARIRELVLNTRTAYQIAMMLERIFVDNQSPCPAFKRLSCRSHIHGPTISTPYQIYPRQFLQHNTHMFPALHTLSIPLREYCLPDISLCRSMRTLIIDDVPYQPLRVANVSRLLRFMNQMPNLQALWVTSLDRHPKELVLPLQPNNLHLPILLQHLTHLTVTVLGMGYALLRYITAPNLEELHLNGSGPDREVWRDRHTTMLQTTFQNLAERSPNIRRLALTWAFVNEATWEWIMCCGKDGQPAPFQNLESIAIRDVDPFNNPCSYDFNSSLVAKYIQRPGIPLRRLTLVDCRFRHLTGNDVVELVTTSMARLSQGTFELTVYPSRSIPDFDDLIHVKTLVERGANVRWRKDPSMERTRRQWWVMGVNIDPQMSRELF